MGRVAKSGAWIHILDEISGAHRVISRTLPKHNLNNKKLSPIEKLSFLVPDEMAEVSSTLTPDSDFYALSFLKP